MIKGTVGGRYSCSTLEASETTGALKEISSTAKNRPSLFTLMAGSLYWVSHCTDLWLSKYLPMLTAESGLGWWTGLVTAWTSGWLDASLN